MNSASGGNAARIFVNALSGAGTRLAMMAIGFLLTPFIVHSLGLQNFGLWSVVGSLAGYLGLLDFGLGGAFVKFITEYNERAERHRARMVVTFGALFYAAFGIVLALPVWFLSPWIVHLFKMPVAALPAATLLFRVNFIILVAQMVLGMPGTCVVAMQRMDLASRNNLIGYLSYAVAMLVFLHAGYGIWGAVGAGVVWALVSSTLQYITAVRLFGPLWHNPLRIERAVVARMFGFGGWTQLSSILNIIGLDAGRFISASIVGVASVSYYEIGSKIAFFAKSMPNYALDAIMPAAAAADARDDRETLDRMYRSGTLFVLCATLAIAGFVTGAADPFIHVWMGQTYPFVAGVILWLSLGYVANGLTGVGTTILRAAGMPRYETYLTGVSAGVNIAATVLLAPHFGIIGVAAGTAIGWFAGTAYFLSVYHRIRHTPWWTSVGTGALRLTAAAGLATLALAAFVRVPFIAPLFAHRVSGLAALAIAGIGYLAVYGGLAWISGAFRSDEAQMARRLTARFARRYAA